MSNAPKPINTPVADDWCFIDESWNDGGPEHIGVLGAVVCSWATHEALAREMFRVRRKYFGEAHARDHARELKGKHLLSSATFKLAKLHGFSKNHCVVREILEFAHRAALRIAAVSVYGVDKPTLLSPDPRRLSAPFRDLCVRFMAHLPDHSHGHLVFDQRLGAQEGISIAVHNYLAGIKEPPLRLRALPLVAVSNVCAGLQLADIVAYIVARYSAGDDRFLSWYRLVSQLQIEGSDFQGRRVFGLFRLDWDGQEGFRPRRIRTKKEEPGSSGKEAC